MAEADPLEPAPDAELPNEPVEATEEKAKTLEKKKQARTAENTVDNAFLIATKSPKETVAKSLKNIEICHKIFSVRNIFQFY